MFWLLVFNCRKLRLCGGEKKKRYMNILAMTVWENFKNQKQKNMKSKGEMTVSSKHSDILICFDRVIMGRNKVF